MSRWCEAMESATHLRLPWRLLREKLAPTQPGFPILDVHYKLTLELLDTDLIVSTMCFSTWFVDSLFCVRIFFVVSLSRDNKKTDGMNQYGSIHESKKNVQHLLYAALNLCMLINLSYMESFLYVVISSLNFLSFFFARKLLMPAQQVLLIHFIGTKAAWKPSSEYWTKIIQVCHRNLFSILIYFCMHSSLEWLRNCFEKPIVPLILSDSMALQSEQARERERKKMCEWVSETEKVVVEIGMCNATTGNVRNVVETFSPSQIRHLICHRQLIKEIGSNWTKNDDDENNNKNVLN